MADVALDQHQKQPQKFAWNLPRLGWGERKAINNLVTPEGACRYGPFMYITEGAALK